MLFPLTLATVLLRALVSAMAVTFISQEPCPEAGRKRALPSDKPGALSHENGFPLNNVRVYEVKLTPTRNASVTVHPCGSGMTVWWELGYNSTLWNGGPARAEITANTAV